MTKHNNVYIPRESWPYWTWFAIEFAIVLTAALLISDKVMHVLEEFEIERTNQNWIFWSIVGILFFDWYVILRRFILKRNVLENTYRYI